MSLAADKIQVVPEVSTALHVDEPVKYSAYLGGSTITYKEVISSSYSNSQASFACNPPSPNVVVDRRVYLKCPVTVSFTGTPAAGTKLLQSGYDAFRAFPLHSVMQNLQLTLNNSKMSIEASELIHEMMEYYGENSEQEHLSMTPCYPDQSQEYADLVNTNRNPLAQFGEFNKGVSPRGGFTYSSITNVTDATTASVSATLCEPLMISPLLWGGYEGKGLLHVQNMSVQINWDSNLARMWSHAGNSPSTITGVTVTFGQPSLLFKYITPPATMELPKEVQYDFQDTEVYVSELGSAQASGSTYQMLSSNIQLNTVPRYLLVFAKERRGDRTYAKTDAWQSIEAMDVSFANVSGILSGADKRELFAIARSNGVSQSWTEWSGEATYFESGGASVERHGTAGLMALKFGKDIALNDPSVSVGTPGSYNLQIRCTLKNQNQSRSISPALYVVPVYAGVLTIKDNQSIQQLAVLSQQDVLKASAEAEEFGAHDAYEGYEGGVLVGGKIWGDIAKFAKSALPYVRKGREIAQKAAAVIPGPEAQAAKAALDVAEAVGLGSGGTLIGGKKMSRAQLRAALQM